MTGYVLTPLAQADMDEIWNYTEERWGTAQAKRYIRESSVAWRSLRAIPTEVEPAMTSVPAIADLLQGRTSSSSDS